MRRALLLALLLGTAPVSMTTAALLPLPVAIVQPKSFPVIREGADPFPILILLVHNTTGTPRKVLVEAFLYDKNQVLERTYRLRADVGAGERALLSSIIEPRVVGRISVRAFAGDATSIPLRLLAWLSFDSPKLETRLDAWGKRRAIGSVLVRNRTAHDLHVFLRFRFYNRSNYQVAVCRNEPRPIYTDLNVLIPASTRTRVGCEVSAFEDIPDVPVRVKVELLDARQAR